MFITEPVLGKGLAPTIIPEAVINYFVYNIPVEDTIRNCNDIRKFLMSQRVDKSLKLNMTINIYKELIAGMLVQTDVIYIQ